MTSNNNNKEKDVLKDKGYLYTDYEPKAKSKGFFNKFEYDLFDDKKYVKMPSVRISKIFIKTSKYYRWKIFKNEKLQLSFEDNLLNNEIKKFIYSIDGFKFMLDLFKKEDLSYENLLIKLEEHIKNKGD